MFSVITKIYNKKTKGPTLMELFTATEKLKKGFWPLEMFDVCTTGYMARIDTIFKFFHSRVNIDASIFFTVATIRTFRSARSLDNGRICCVGPNIVTWLHWPKGTDHCNGEEYRCAQIEISVTSNNWCSCCTFMFLTAWWWPLSSRNS
jgi:hypothetical protein